MGGAVSSGKDNDELIDNLKEAEYIKSQDVEQVFRIVDRAHYYMADYRDSAYKDLAWKSGTLHLSAPCIYSEVMEALELKPGMSFLNLGSGTGYLNTMAGFMIGPYGINHGIEMHEDNVTYALKKLESFRQSCNKFDDLESCEPKFVVGNCLNLAPENRLYDRVYCGASCPTEKKETIQNLLKVEGILVIPIGDQLLKIKRESDLEFTSVCVLPVSFASLVVPAEENDDPIMLPETHPLSLQYICRLSVRQAIRDTFDFDQPSVKAHSAPNPLKMRTRFFRRNGRYPLDILPTAQGLMIMGPFDDHMDEEEDEDSDDHDDFLSRQLQRHAQELRRVGQHLVDIDSKHSTDEIDSDMGEEGSEFIVDTKDINGNRNRSREDEMEGLGLEVMDSEDGLTADDDEEEVEGEERKSFEGRSNGQIKKTRHELIKATKKENSSESASFSGAPEPTNSNSYTHLKYQILGGISGKMTGYLEEDGSQRKVSERSLSSEDEVSQVSSRSSAIQVNTFPNQASQPCTIKTSYSTSADTSETSGFGSLGEDILPLGFQQSIDESRKDDLSDGNNENLKSNEDVSDHATNVFSDQREILPWSKTSRDKEHLENEPVESADTNWMDMDDEEDSEDYDDDLCFAKSLSIKNKFNRVQDNSEDYDDNEDDHVASPRGRDFSTFLKENVNTLPIPSSLKDFILHYR